MSTTPNGREQAAVQVRLPIHNPPGDLKLATGCVIFIGIVLTVSAGLLLWLRRDDPVAHVVTPGLALLAVGCFCVRPILGRYLRRHGALVRVRVEFGPDGFGQPLEDETTLVLPWAEVRGFVFREGQPADRVALAVSLVDEAAVRYLAPGLRHESEDGYILSSAMAREEAEKAAAAIERYRPGLRRWTSKNVRRGGFGLPHPVKPLIRRWRATEPRSVVGADQASAGRKFFLWAGWLAVVADFTAPAFYDIPPGIPLPVAVVIWVLLYRTRYRGDLGEFVLTAAVITWRPREGAPVVVRRADLARLTTEPPTKSATRHYVTLRAISRDGDELLVKKISRPAAERVTQAAAVETVG
ncbi:hypothetical protein [Amycolatopsis sp. NPDC051128]|uniref:hypothetical protein n=1 Tax=Amycolatopsis sp. NPDC051128 TaxID=3155412 RepID=UPI00341FABBB